MMWSSGQSHRVKGLLILLLLLFHAALLGLGTESENTRDNGIKYNRIYHRKIYDLQSQNWCVAQDNRGIIYVANQGGLLEYDGVEWREISLPNKTVRSLAVDGRGNLFIGGFNEFGMLAPGRDGCPTYRSLVHPLAEDQKEFGHVWRICALEEGVYFSTTRYIFYWDYNKVGIKAAAEGKTFAPLFLYNGHLYTRRKGKGLLEVTRGALTLKPVPGGETFAARKIYMMADHPSGSMLTGTLANGFYLSAGNTFSLFETPSLDRVTKGYLLHGIGLSSGDYALATFAAGFFALDRHGNFKYRLDTSSGLPTNHINYVFEDRRGNLWLALEEGIAKIEYHSPFSIFQRRGSGLQGKVLSVLRFGPGNTLYAGTGKGLFRRHGDGTFKRVPGISRACWDLAAIHGSLLAATTNGVFHVKEHSVEAITRQHAYKLLPCPGGVRVGKSVGFSALYFDTETKRWLEQPRDNTVSTEIRTMVENPSGTLWLGTPGGVLKVKDGGISTLDHRHGLPRGRVSVFNAGGHVIFATSKGIYRLDPSTGGVVPDTFLGKEFAGGEEGSSVFLVREAPDKSLWLVSKSRILRAVPRPGGGYQIKRNPFRRIPLTGIAAIYPDPATNSVWFACMDGLIHYDSTYKKREDDRFRALIRGVWANNRLIFYGEGRQTGIELKYRDRNLRFRFAAPFFQAEDRTLYRCRLDQYDLDWTPWSREIQKEYTNIQPGFNTFRVQARNVYGGISREAVYSFRVLAPWYRSWWAYALYSLAAGLLMGLLVRWRSAQLVKDKTRLEEIIKDRTCEIENKNEQLREMDRIKSRFFANISHEFRTPLTLIMGPMEQLLDEAPDKSKRKRLRMMLRNSRRLLGLINQLLELSRFDSGKVTLEASLQDLVPFLKGITASFEPVAARGELDLDFQCDETSIQLYMDSSKLEEALTNILVNAVKFTPGGGRITVSARLHSQSEDEYPAGFGEIVISDTGPGISRDQLTNIFDRFFQGGNNKQYRQKGTGIGLAIAREMVELHRGSITVHSREGENSGSQFFIRLPLGNDHLKPTEMVSPDRPFSSLKKSQSSDGGEYPDREDLEDTGEFEIEAKSEEREIILVVDDSADTREYIRSALGGQYNVVQAVDGRDGLEKAAAMVPDLVISDVMMPGVDGYELCRTLKNDVNTSHIPVILLTARASEESMVLGLETGADDYITKPFNTRILEARVKNLIELRKQFQRGLNREMTLRPVQSDISDIDREFIGDLKKVLETHLPDADFGVEQLSKKLYMGRTTLYRKILALSGETPTEFIRSYRLKRGAELLKSGFGSVLEVAFEVGFSSANYFTKCFKKKFHQLPSEYQANHHT